MEHVLKKKFILILIICFLPLLYTACDAGGDSGATCAGNVTESESNNTFGTGDSLGTSDSGCTQVVDGNFSVGDVDYFIGVFGNSSSVTATCTGSLVGTATVNGSSGGAYFYQFSYTSATGTYTCTFTFQ